MRARGQTVGSEKGAHGRGGEYTLSENTTGKFEMQAELAKMPAHAYTLLHRRQQLSADQTGRMQIGLRQYDAGAH